MTLQIETIPAKNFVKNRKTKNWSLNAVKKIQVESYYTEKGVEVITLHSTIFAMTFSFFGENNKKCCPTAI